VLTFIPGVAAYKHWAGMLNGIAILGFFANMIVLAKLARRKLKAATANIPQVNRQAQSMQC